MVSTMIDPDVLEYPDSGKVAAVDAKGEGIFQMRRGEAVPYSEDES
jgi:uncharacterized cupin superfamily protein